MTRFAIPNGGRARKATPNPERLTEGEFGCLLKDGNRELADGLDQSAAFQRLTERLSTSRADLAARRAYWAAPVALAAFAVFAVLPAIVRKVRPTPVPLIAAEELHGYAAKSLVPRPAATVAPTPRPAQVATRGADETSATGSKRTVHTPSVGPATSAVSSPVPPNVAQLPEPQPLPTPSAGGSAESKPAADVSATPDCLSLARRGQTRDAEACFSKRAEGSGLGAEMALYEVARLRRDVLGDAAGALRVLGEYRTRFPAGSLHREVDMSQLELLVQLGRSDEALKQSEALLASSASGERAAELHALRGHILRKTRAFAAAAREYELAESAGARRGDLTYFHAICLDALGRGAEAAALLTQYLEQPQHSYAADARRRLERLDP